MYINISRIRSIIKRYRNPESFRTRRVSLAIATVPQFPRLQYNAQRAAGGGLNVQSTPLELNRAAVESVKK